MAKVRVFGSEIYATPIEKTAGGDWLMEAKQHAGRCSPGTKILVQQHEIIEMAAAEMPPDAPMGIADLERAMAEERKTLPSAAEIVQKFHAEATKPGGPTRPRAAAPNGEQS